MSVPTTSDVFLSATASDRGVAEVVRRRLEERGLRVFSGLDVGERIGDRWEDAIRSAMAEARAFVAILSRSSMNSSWIAMELGAAQAWGKAIDLLLEGTDPTEVPSFLARYPMRPLTRLPEVLREIERGIEPLSDDQARRLGELYATIGVTTDQLSSHPTTLDRLTRRFNQRERVSFSPERVLQELIRLRKQGRLPKLKRKTG